MAGCNECRFYKRDSSIRSIDLALDITRKCELGNDSQMNKWWEDNGKKFPGQDVIDDMPCHEYHPSTLSLIKMNELAGKLLDLVDTKSL